MYVLRKGYKSLGLPRADATKIKEKNLIIMKKKKVFQQKKGGGGSLSTTR